jgi:hypothetical protein
MRQEAERENTRRSRRRKGQEEMTAITRKERNAKQTKRFVLDEAAKENNHKRQQCFSDQKTVERDIWLKTF